MRKFYTNEKVSIYYWASRNEKRFSSWGKPSDKPVVNRDFFPLPVYMKIPLCVRTTPPPVRRALMLVHRGGDW